MSKTEPRCHCGESGYYHCSELRQKVEEMREVIRIILEADALRSHAFEGWDDEPSIYDMCKAALRLPEAGDEQ